MNRQQKRAAESRARREAKRARQSAPAVAREGGSHRADHAAKEAEMLRAAKAATAQANVARLARECVLVVIDLMDEDQATPVLYAIGRRLPPEEAQHSLVELRVQYAASEFPYTYFSFWMRREAAPLVFQDLGLKIDTAALRLIKVPAIRDRVLTCIKLGANLTVVNKDYSEVEQLDAPYNSGAGPGSDEEHHLPSFSVSLYEPKEIYAEKIGSRKLVYLDHNVWINLRDARTAEAVACLDECQSAVARDKALFPLAFPAITEALEIPNREARLAHADLLDVLSHGITFRSTHVLFALEGRAAYRWFFKDDIDCSLPRNELFTNIPDHLGDGRLKFPPGWIPEKVEQLVSHVKNNPLMRSVRFVAEQLDWAQEHVLMRDRYVREMEQVRLNLLAEPKLPKQAAFERALQRERVSILNSFVVPEFTGTLASEVGVLGIKDAMKQLLERKGEGSSRRLKEVFRRIPALDQYARILALDAIERSRHPVAQDFYDIEHGSAPPVYTDAFVTMDHRLARLVRDAGRGKATLLTSLPDLTNWLRANCR
ncbi:hypothetical protein WME77_19315 [Sorangium sp. So ce764]|uniref:hypothetical protein n=1 Tax=Sorangium sp. So ce764 TaxID=3133320 RepID=UPI003F620E23